MDTEKESGSGSGSGSGRGGDISIIVKNFEKYFGNRNKKDLGF